MNHHCWFGYFQSKKLVFFWSGKSGLCRVDLSSFLRSHVAWDSVKIKYFQIKHSVHNLTHSGWKICHFLEFSRVFLNLCCSIEFVKVIMFFFFLGKMLELKILIPRFSLKFSNWMNKFAFSGKLDLWVISRDLSLTFNFLLHDKTKRNLE